MIKSFYHQTVKNKLTYTSKDKNICKYIQEHQYSNTICFYIADYPFVVLMMNAWYVRQQLFDVLSFLGFDRMNSWSPSETDNEFIESCLGANIAIKISSTNVNFLK